MPATVATATAPPPQPVFVDDSGRRHRLVRVVGWVAAAVITVYLALLAVSLVGSPGLVPLSLPAFGRVLPGPAAPLVPGGHSAGDVLPTTAATRATRTPASTSTTVVSTAGSSAAATVQQPRTQPRRAAQPATTPVVRATPTPSATPTSHGTSTSTTQRSTQPSHGPSTHPTPHSTHATGAVVASPVATATP